MLLWCLMMVLCHGRFNGLMARFVSMSIEVEIPNQKPSLIIYLSRFNTQGM